METLTITLDAEQTAQFEDAGPAGEGYRARLRNQYRGRRVEILACDDIVLDVLPADTDYLIEVCDWYRYGDGDYVAVLTGMPSEHVMLGTGDSQESAIANLTRTPIQCTSADSGTARALDWALSAGHLDTLDGLGSLDSEGV